jgi:hypothetical protein
MTRRVPGLYIQSATLPVRFFHFPDCRRSARRHALSQAEPVQVLTVTNEMPVAVVLLRDARSRLPRCSVDARQTGDQLCSRKSSRQRTPLRKRNR